MEASGLGLSNLRQPSYSCSVVCRGGGDAISSSSSIIRAQRLWRSSSYGCGVSLTWRPRKPIARVVANILNLQDIDSNSLSEFTDTAHLQYYAEDEKKKKKQMDKKSIKKKLKLVKAFCKELCGDDALIDRSQAILLQETAEGLIKKLKELREEEKELKRMKKKQQKIGNDSSSSSSSEGREVVDMRKPLALLTHQDSNAATQTKTVVCCEDNRNRSSAPPKRIEVCMGNKCKKSGGGALLDEFQRVLDEEDAAAVVGCKCMGKCKDGPNVRLINSVSVPFDPLCIGVALEDVDLIVANFFGEEDNNHLSLAPAAAASSY